MRLLQQTSEDEVVAEFLKAEINSKRFGDKIKNALDSAEPSIISNPDITDATQNQFRKRLLGKVRGYGNNTELFEDFPPEVIWHKAIFSRKDLCSVMYINYSYWNELSGNSRLPMDAAKNIQNGIEVFGVSNDGFKDIHLDIKLGYTFPKMIFITANEKARIVVLEGHARITAYFLETEYIPEEIEVIIGYSEDFLDMDLY